MNLDFIIQLLVWAVIAVAAYALLFHLLRNLAGRTRFEGDNIVLRTVRLPLFIAVLAFGLVSVFEELRLSPEAALFVRNSYVVALIAAGTFLAWRIVKEVVLRWVAVRAAETENRVDDLIVPLVSTLGPLIFFLAGLVAILQYLGVDVLLLAASLGIAGLVLGLAFQDSLANVFNGIYLMVDPAFVENDLIRLDDDKVYSVEKVGLRMTRLYDLTNHALIFLPNTTLAQGRIANISKPTIDLKVAMGATMPAGTDPDEGALLLHEVMASHRNILGKPEAKLRVLKARLMALAACAPERASTLAAAISKLDEWQAGDAGNEQAYRDLLGVRKDMNDTLAAAQRAIKSIGGRRAALEPLRNAIEAVDEKGMDEISTGRIERIRRGMTFARERISASRLVSLEAAIAQLETLDAREDRLEASINAAEQARESELDRLLATLVWTGDWVAEDLAARGNVKEASRVSLWVRNIAVLYAELEVDESVDGLDRELSDLIGWLNELETGGLTRIERARVRALFGAWGGIKLMEKRRVAELSRRINRWLEWKEKDAVTPAEFEGVQAMWDRRLRVLSRKLPDTGTGDEEALDNALIATRKWMHSIYFRERLTEWKLPTVALKQLSGDGLDFTMTFYVDDIKQQHYDRQRYVMSDLMMDLHESCKRAGIEVPTAG
ncbi:MAG TPA: mechanosensitive ion channel domain-containing protein [Chloroflexia bacterium]|nr:mechanosensitive ion channel domain-containing protein [Chloroflexia bacterium]